MVCFVVNNDVTRFYIRISKHLTSFGIKVCWISPSDYWSTYLIQKGIDANDVLNLTRANHRKLNSEKSFSFPYISTNAILAIDRNLRKRKKGQRKNYITFSTVAIFEFLKKLNVKYVIGESTTAIELISANLIKEKGGHFIRMMTTRIPNNRTLLFDDCFERFCINLNNTFEQKKPLEIHENFLNKNVKPAYFQLRNSRPTLNFSRLSHYLHQIFSRLDRRDFTYPTFSERVTIVIKKQLNFLISSFLARRTNYFSNKNCVTDTKYILVTLHKQPESTVDLLGYPFSNQIETVKRISSIIPEGYILAVKEHSHALEDRTFPFYNKLKRIDNVKLINPYEESRDWIKNSELVISICGTSSLESKLLGKPSATLVPLYFNKLLDIPVLDLHKYESKKQLLQILEQRLTEEKSREVNLDYFGKILTYSGKFTVGNIEKVPETLTDNNVLTAAESLKQAFQVLEMQNE